MRMPGTEIACARSVDLAEELSLALPEEVQIEPTGPGKYGPGRSPAFLCYDTFCRLLGEFAGARVLRLQGAGEPLAHPRFFDMVRFAVARGLQVSTLTALPPLTPRRAEECAKSGLQYLDVLAPADGGGALLWRTVERLQKAKKASGAVLPWIRLVVPATSSMRCCAWRASAGSMGSRSSTFPAAGARSAPRSRPSSTRQRLWPTSSACVSTFPSAAAAAATRLRAAPTSITTAARGPAPWSAPRSA